MAEKISYLCGSFARFLKGCIWVCLSIAVLIPIIASISSDGDGRAAIFFTSNFSILFLALAIKIFIWWVVFRLAEWILKPEDTIHTFPFDNLKPDPKRPPPLPDWYTKEHRKH